MRENESMGEQAGSEQSYGAVVVVESVENQETVPALRELSRDRYIANDIGSALNAHAPDPAPGAQWLVTYVGRGRRI